MGRNKSIRRVVNWGWPLSWLIWIGEQGLQARAGEDWAIMPWFEISVLATVLWAGFHLNEVYRGDHWLNQKWGAWRDRLSWGPTRYVNIPAGYEVYADVKFTRHVTNVVVRIETLKEVHTLNSVVWKRVAIYDALNRLECNAGHVEEVKLIQVLDQPKAEPVNALAAYAAQVPPPPPNQGEGFFRVQVTITGSGMKAAERVHDFWWQSGCLQALPMTPSANEFAGDADNLRKGGFTLWKTAK